MKSNLGLLLILIGLISFAYFSEERKQSIEESFKKEGRVPLIANDILEIRFADFLFKKNGNKWLAPKMRWQPNQEKLTNLTAYLRRIVIIDTMVKDESQTWGQGFFLEVNGEKIHFLGHSQVTDVFYILDPHNAEKVLVAKDLNPLREAYKSDAQAGKIKFLKLKKLLNSSQYSFMSHNILEAFDLSEIAKIKVENKRNVDFEINLTTNETNPASFSERGYHSIAKILPSLFNVLEVKRIYDSGNLVLKEKRSTVLLETPSGNKKIELYIGLNDKFGKFLRLDNHSTIYEVELPDINIFYAHVQLFWDKRINYKTDFTKLKRLDFKLRKSPISPFKDFFVEDLKSFKVRSDDEEIVHIDTTRMNFLFNLLFNLTEFNAPDYILKQEKERSKSDIEVKLLNRHFGVRIEVDGIVLFDFERKIEIYFKNNNQAVQSGFFDKIFTVKRK